MLKLNNKSLLLIIPVFLSFLFSCEEPPSEIGIDFKLPDQRLDVKYSDTNTVYGLVYSLDSIRSDESSYSLLGSVIDPVFGTTNASFTTQLILSEKFEPGDDAKADSLFLYLLNMNTYGDENAPMKLNVWHSFRAIYIDSAYYSNFNIHTTPGAEIVGSVDYLAGDSIIKVSLDTAFGNWLISDKDALVSQAAFQDHFKGLYIESENISGGDGGIATLDVLSSQSGMVLYYGNSEQDSLGFVFEINTQAARVATFSHDYTTADELTKIQHLNDNIQDTVVYVQGVSGVYTKLELPFLDVWRDSMPLAVNIAEFIIELDDTSSFAIGDYPPPGFYDLVVKTEDGLFTLLEDTRYGEDYSGGRLDSAFVYFRVTNHIQNYLERLNDQSDFYLFVRSQQTVPQRSIFKSPINSKNLQFKFTYTRITE
ncbi:MAG: DUF4270 family protein [Bacteroidales bacterium]|nr:DUF4270 family protein [Bacteroidales bacterium]